VAETRLNRYWAIVIIFLIAVIIITVFVGWSRYRPSLPIEISLQPEQEISGNININGAVNNPGIYQFSGGDTIGSLIQAAGGVTVDGKSDNLVLNIPQAAGAMGTPQKININRAEAWLLEALPGIGPTKSKAIIDYRLQNGFFRSVDELIKVQGISSALLEQIKPLITVSD
jgi:competence protein ComEA